MTRFHLFLTHLQTNPTLAEYLAILSIVLLVSLAAVHASIGSVEALAFSEAGK